MDRPICPYCNIETEIHSTMSGDQYQCDNYHLCGFFVPVEKVAAESSPASETSSSKGGTTQESGE